MWINSLLLQWIGEVKFAVNHECVLSILVQSLELCFCARLPSAAGRKTVAYLLVRTGYLVEGRKYVGGLITFDE
ncbi:hypothetical protein LCGC14_1562870 [marine sediment metagenome]|uniref:Uncharacterized protein n=1 Tax=marine sediment metagenome TaxID=412755 RepID=A0A0F9IM01_9ZZZZ